MPDNDNEDRKQPSRQRGGEASNDNQQVSSQQVADHEGAKSSPRGEATIGAGNKVHGDELEGIIPGKSQSQNDRARAADAADDDDDDDGEPD